MKNLGYVMLVCLMALIMPFAFAAETAAKGTTQQKPKPVAQTIAKYTVIPVVLDDTVNTVKNKTGDKIEVHCTGPKCGGFPSGTTFVGVLTITPAQGEKPAKGSAKFTSAILPDGRKIQLEAVPSSAEGVKTEEAKGGTTKQETQKKVAVVGAGIGAMSDGFRGAVIGAAAGAVVGNQLKGKGKDIEFKAGTKGFIVLTKSATIPPPPAPKSSKPK